ncbi:MAG: hypothetical protein A2Y07_04760 [Planctomycetes bacterium GWF2_50_10]|nr:MAG: hypothetical protein A2Y07_04760 [Planctomycetes bacterium GWF2_50_10]
MERSPKSYKSVLILVALLLAVTFAIAAETGNEKQTSTSVFSLRNISAQQAKDYLSQLNLGKTVSIIKATNAVVVTADTTSLLYARNLLSVVDSDKNYVIQIVGRMPDKLPDLSAMNAKLEGIKVGKISDPPVTGSTEAAIFGEYGGRLIIVAPQDKVDIILSASKESQAQEQAPTAPKEVASAQESQEKQVEEQKTVDEANVPSLKQIDEAVESASEKDGEPNAFLNEVVGELLEQKNKEEQALREAQIQKQAREDQQRQNVEPEQVSDMQTQPEVSKSIRVNLPQHDAIEAAKNVDPNAYRPIDKDIPNGDQLVKIDLPEVIQISTLLELVGEALHLNYLYDPAKITGQVSVKMRERLTVRELYALTESVLKFAGYAMSRRDNLVTVVPIAEMQSIDPAIKVNSGTVKPGDVIVTSVFRLNYISIENAINLLNNMRLGMTNTGQSNVFPLYESNSIIVTEFAYRMDRIEKLLKLVDQPGTPRQFRYRQLKYTLASAIVPKIQSLAQQLGPDTLNVQTGAVTSPQAGRMRTPRAPTPQPQPQPAGGGTGRAGVYLDYDERTNRILMVGGEDELELIEQLLNTFDVPQQDLRAIKEYQVQYVDAQQIVETLNTLGIISGYEAPSAFRSSRGPGMVQSTPAMAGGAPGQAQTTEAPVEQPQIAILEATNSLLVNATPEQHAAILAIISHVDREPAELSIPYTIYPLEYQDPAELQKVLSELIEKTIKDKEGKVQATLRRDEDIAIVADEKAFSLVVYASKKNQEWIGALIKQLDRKRPQVLIETTLVEISRDDAFNYDLQMVGTFDGSFAGQKGGTSGDIIAPISSSDAGVNRRDFATGASQGQFFYSDKHIQALLTAIQTKSYGRVLAKPKVLVNDNESGKITQQDTRYVAQTTTTIPDQGGPVESTTFQAYDAKIELEITPHISEGDLLLLEIKLIREDFGPDQPPVGDPPVTPPPNKLASNVDSVVTVPDGATIILGGLTKLNQTKTGSKIPLLGDIPIVGALFRSADNQDAETKLYVFVKAYVLRPSEKTRGLPQLEAISRESRSAFEKSEKKFQNVQTIPGIPSKPWDPVHVLEEQ